MTHLRQEGQQEPSAEPSGEVPDVSTDEPRDEAAPGTRVVAAGAPPAPPRMSLGERVKELRTALELSQRQVADAVRIDVTYLSKLENGRQRWSDEKLRLLARVLKVPPAELLGLETRVAGEVQAPPAGRTAASARRQEIRPFGTSFIDRKAAMKDLQQVWRPGRLVTLSGPPGCGKTRLAAEYARTLEGPGVTWVTVEEDDDPDRLGGKLAESGGGQVVVLDDADLALSSSVDIARRLLRGSPDITVLATSRQPLGLHGEQILPLGGLSVPDEYLRPHQTGRGLTPDLEQLQLQESVNLFVDRAGLAEPGFRLDPGNAAAVFDVCRWLDGLPLAIELAALRLRQMTVMDLAAHLDDLLAWLTGNTPDVPARHAGLEAAIAWSFDRLTEEQRKVAVRLTSFEAAFNLDDAEDVAADDATPPEGVRAIVLDLVDRSLLMKQRDPDRRAIYRWPHPVRHYGRRELARGPDAPATEERYRSWRRHVIESLSDDEREKPRSQAEWARLAELTSNLLAGIYSLPLEEQQEALTRLRAGRLNMNEFGNPSLDAPWLPKPLEQRPEVSQDVFRDFGVRARIHGDFDTAHDHFHYAHLRAEHMRDPLGQADTLVDLAQNAIDRGEYAEAEDFIDRAGDLYEKLGRKDGLVEVLNLRGKLLLATSDPRAAERVFEEARVLAGELDDLRLLAYSVQNLGVCDQQLRRLARARQRLKASLDIRLGMQNQRGAARVVEAFALVEADMGNHAAALQLLGAAGQYRSSMQMLGVGKWWRGQLDDLVEEARAAFASKPAEVERLLRLGAALSLAEAGELALHGTAAVLPEQLDGPIAAPLRRPVEQDCGGGEGPAGAVARAAGEAGGEEGAMPAGRLGRDQAPDSGPEDVHRRLRTAALLALAEPVGDRIEDLLCFALDPGRHRGVVVPLFTSHAALGEALRRHPQWAERAVVSVRLDQLRPPVRGETIVVDPWTPAEHRFEPGENDYLPVVEPVSST